MNELAKLDQVNVTALFNKYVNKIEGFIPDLCDCCDETASDKERNDSYRDSVYDFSCDHMHDREIQVHSSTDIRAAAKRIAEEYFGKEEPDNGPFSAEPAPPKPASVKIHYCDLMLASEIDEELVDLLFDEYRPLVEQSIPDLEACTDLDGSEPHHDDFMRDFVTDNTADRICDGEMRVGPQLQVRSGSYQPEFRIAARKIAIHFYGEPK